jgi:hypothetical protein
MAEFEFGSLSGFSDVETLKTDNTANQLLLTDITTNGAGTTQLIDFDMWIPETQPNTWANNTTMTTAQFLALFYDGYVGTANGYTVTKTSLGKEESGVYDIYKYEFTPEKYDRTVLLTSGMHASEEVAMFGLARLIHYMMETPELHKGLSYLKNKVKLIVVPCLNPWGFNQSPSRSYTNSANVNINRNWETNGRWSLYTPPTIYDGKGTAPFDQSEASLLRDLYISLANTVDFTFDCHTSTGIGNYDQYISYLSRDTVVRPKLDVAIAEITQYLADNELGSGANVITTDSASSLRQHYLMEQLGINGAVIEFVPTHFGGSYIGSTDITYYLMFLAHYLFRTLSVDVTVPTLAVRQNTVNDLSVLVAKLQARLDALDTKPSVLAVDHFDRDNNLTTLGYLDTNQPWLTTAGTFGITSNKAIAKTMDGVQEGRVVVDVGTGDFDVSADITLSSYAGLFLRYKDESNYLAARLTVPATSATPLSISKKIAGVITTIGTDFSVTPVAGTTYNLRITAKAGAIKVYIDGVEKISVSDTALQTETKTGLRVSSDLTSTFNNFIVKAT